MKIYRACITGTRNTMKRRACQDCCDYMVTSDNFVMAALSDGAGSAKFSDFAARENVHAFFNLFRRYEAADLFQINDKAMAEDVIHFCRKAQESLADRIGTELRELSATLIGFVIGAKEIMIFHIGDGAAYIADKNGKIRCVSKPENVLGMSNRTRFTVDGNADEYMRVTRIARDEVNAICIFSDGVFPTKKEEKIADELRKIFTKTGSNRRLCELIDSREINEYGDDHSMILVNLRDGNGGDD